MLVKDAVPTDHPHFRYVGAIEREVERIARVTRQLYETYRPEQDTTGAASLHLVVGDAVAFLEQVNRSRDVRIVTDLARVAATVSVPAAILRQIVYNLVQNAVDASPFGGTVDIVGKVERGHLILAVLDQGDGVPLELRHKIFEPFFTTKDATVRTSGMGLGLTMVARSVSAAGGTIVVDDVPGGGARFTVRLPLSD
jgi:signal transduction histidine kinase